MSQEHTGRFPGQFALLESIRHQRYRQALLLVEAGVDIDSKNSRGLTPLMCACMYVEDPKLRVKFVQLFLEAGADVNSQDWRGLTALMHAINMTRVETVVLLLEHPKLDLNVSDQDGNSAAMYAAMGHSIEILARILEAYRRAHGSVIPALEYKNVRGETLMALASANRQQDLVPLLEHIARKPNENLKGFFSEKSAREKSAAVIWPSATDSSNDPPAFHNPDPETSDNTRDLPTIAEKASKHNEISKASVPDTPGESASKDKAGQNGKCLTKQSSQVSILPLLSLSGVDVSSSDPWEWDLGATGHKVKSGERKTVTGSRSLNEDQSMLSEYLDDHRNKDLQLGNGIDRLSSSFGGLSVKDSSPPSLRFLSSTEVNSQGMLPTRNELRLPPLPKTLRDSGITINKT